MNQQKVQVILIHLKCVGRGVLDVSQILYFEYRKLNNPLAL